jgi:hypothetical protein
MDFIIESPNSVVSKWLSLGADASAWTSRAELPDEFIAALRRKVKE